MVAGRYTLRREIGRGGMGSVWLAHDEVLGRPVALKWISTPPGAVLDLARAEREARLAARLSHPHVVAVYDLIDEGERRWLVMEYVEGQTLGQLIRGDGPLAPERAAQLLGQAADALAAAHSAGVVHRDVKPSNILVTPEGQVKLTDFGIARALADTTLTQTGMVTGSPAYLAPEVAAGGSATEASDVWSLGATLFHALSGRPPYDVSDNVLGVLYRIVHEEPPRLPNAGWLAPVLASTMATDARRRWPMAQVRDVLGAGRATEEPAAERTLLIPPARSAPAPVLPSPPAAAPVPLAAPPATSGTRTSGAGVAGRRRWPLVAAAAAVAVVLAVVAGMLVGDRGREAANRPPAGAGDGTARSDTGTTAPTNTPTDTTPSGPTAAGMERFVGDYLSTVTADPAAAWQRLTPAFRRASGGFGAYRDFWGGIRSARLRGVEADPRSLTVSYEVSYSARNGRSFSDRVELRLVYRAGRYLIDGEF